MPAGAALKAFRQCGRETADHPGKAEVFGDGLTIEGKPAPGQRSGTERQHIGMPPRGFDRMEVFGEGWAARIEPNPRPIEIWGAQAAWPMPLEIRTGASGPTGMMAEELRAFCRVVRGRQAVPIGATYADALQVQAWMDRLAACA